MASADAIFSSQVAGECCKINEYVASPVVQVQKQQSDGSTASGSRREVKKEMNNAAVSVKIVSKAKQQLKARFAVELDGLNCFETLVPR